MLGRGLAGPGSVEPAEQTRTRGSPITNFGIAKNRLRDRREVIRPTLRQGGIGGEREQSDIVRDRGGVLLIMARNEGGGVQPNFRRISLKLRRALVLLSKGRGRPERVILLR